jgi:hypothetical protein
MILETYKSEQIYRDLSKILWHHENVSLHFQYSDNNNLIVSSFLLRENFYTEHKIPYLNVYFTNLSFKRTRVTEKSSQKEIQYAKSNYLN